MTKKVWIVYDKTRIEVNGYFAKRLSDEVKTSGADSEIILDGEINGVDLPDIAIMRMTDAKLSAELERRGVKVINSARVSALANDKWATYLFAKANGFPCIPTVLAVDTGPEQRFPAVVKSRYGHGGSEVFWAADREEYNELLNKIDPKDFILQRPADTLGKDLRVYAMGGEIYKAVLRTSEKDFRSNYSLGGDCRLYELGKTEKTAVKKIIEAVDGDFVGVDFIFDGGRIVLNEIEDVVGCRMLYKLTDDDAAEVFVRTVVKKLL